MRYFLSAILLVSISFSGISQTYEVGLLAGGANYIGDVGRTNYILPNELAFGGIFKWNRSPRHSFRGSIMFANISGDDSKSSDARRVERGLNFKNTITEFGLGLEYTFWEFDLHAGEPQSTPYLYSGVHYFLFKELRRLGDEISDYDSNSSFAIPIALGYKATIGTRFILAGEIGARYTFTDNLDGSNPTKGAPGNNDDIKFGNLNNNDWYVFTGITLTFAFGRQPCYCNF
ncbi:DUF6089 family protein [Aureitalea marina]|uniref:DUF6089 domain-containing protein n=1 Tax=Aureitalea marina TaxID=930804 RepID=A0A2S7KR65_9FLAO|nr:DUF6089 family protein [Aureitalea marina]PQB05119.1 hypothetical protein BST85_09620 [Aureitalea marina]